MELWAEMGQLLLPILIAILPVTVLVMAAAGRTTQALTARNKKRRPTMTELLNDFLTGSVAWGVLLTLAAFGLGVLINKVTGKAIFNPLLLGSIFVIIFLSMCNIPYGDYKTSAAPVSYLLLPATVALAIPLYENWICSRRMRPPSSQASRWVRWSVWAAPLRWRWQWT